MRDIFCDSKVLFDIDQLNNTVTLREENTMDKIEIGGLPVDAFIIKLDVNDNKYKQKSFYLRRGETVIHKGCDYCLICPSIKKIIFFELKSERPKGYIDQFRVSYFFLNYCLELWEYKFNDNNHIIFDYIFVLISKKNSYQPTTTKEILKLQLMDRCNKNIEILSPGFPNRIKLQKLL